MFQVKQRKQSIAAYYSVEGETMDIPAILRSCYWQVNDLHVVSLIPGCRHICVLLLLKSFTRYQSLFTCLFTLKITCQSGSSCSNLSPNTSHSHRLLQSCLFYDVAQRLSTHDPSKSTYQVTISSLICEIRDTDVPLRIVMRLKWQYVFKVYSTGPGSQYAHNICQPLVLLL